MDRINTLINNIEQAKNKSRGDLLALTESPIEKIFLLCLLNFIENNIINSLYSKINIDGYSFINNSDIENLIISNKIIGLQIISCGTGVTVNYPNGVPLSDGSFLKIDKNSLRRGASTIHADDNSHFSYVQKISFFPQYQVQIDKSNYRLDFAFLLYENINHQSTLVKKVGIECDGYDYHSSPKHFKRDRERGRKLQQDDWTLIRYSGSDINMKLHKNFKYEIEEIFDSMGFGVFNR